MSVQDEFVFKPAPGAYVMSSSSTGELWVSDRDCEEQVNGSDHDSSTTLSLSSRTKRRPRPEPQRGPGRKRKRLERAKKYRESKGLTWHDDPEEYGDSNGDGDDDDGDSNAHSQLVDQKAHEEAASATEASSVIEYEFGAMEIEPDMGRWDRIVDGDDELHPLQEMAAQWKQMPEKRFQKDEADAMGDLWGGNAQTTERPAPPEHPPPPWMKRNGPKDSKATPHWREGEAEAKPKAMPARTPRRPSISCAKEAEAEAEREVQERAQAQAKLKPKAKVKSFAPHLGPVTLLGQGAIDFDVEQRRVKFNLGRQLKDSILRAASTKIQQTREIIALSRNLSTAQSSNYLSETPNGLERVYVKIGLRFYDYAEDMATDGEGNVLLDDLLEYGVE